MNVNTYKHTLDITDLEYSSSLSSFIESRKQIREQMISGYVSLSSYVYRMDKQNKFLVDSYNKWKDEYTVDLGSFSKITGCTINCKSHGKVLVNEPKNFLKNGCPKCNRNVPEANEDFIKRLKAVHGNTYDYSKVNFKNQRAKITITCKQHGDFLQMPYDHLRGNGCRQCWAASRSSKAEVDFLNYLEIPESNRSIRIHPYIADACIGNVVYEYLGDLWHGNPNPNKPLVGMIPKSKSSYHDLLLDTERKFNRLNTLGYEVAYIWESDWNNFVAGKLGFLPLQCYNGTLL